MTFRVMGPSVLTARLRVEPADFVVEEIPSFDASGAGEHLLLTVRKQGLTTADVAAMLSKWARVPLQGVSYAGLKDKHGITTQRFSIQIPRKVEPADPFPASDALQLIDQAWHSRKLPRGALIGNAFVMTLRDVDGDRNAIEERLELLKNKGFPNVFGEQRFGRGDNVGLALQMFNGKRVARHLRGLLLSAARSHLFNDMVQRRYALNLYDQLVEGDVLMLDGSRSIFGPIVPDAELLERFARLDVVPTAALWGTGELRTTGVVAQYESDCVQSDAQSMALAHGLERAGLRQERRALIARAGNLEWEWLDATTLRLRFDLSPGSYATSLLDQLGEVTDVKRAG